MKRGNKACLNKLDSVFASFLVFLTGFWLLMLKEGACLHINDLVVPDVVKNGTASAVVLDCDYSLDSSDVGLVVKWFLNDGDTPVYQWIPPQRPQDLGKLKMLSEPGSLYANVLDAPPVQGAPSDFPVFSDDSGFWYSTITSNPPLCHCCPCDELDQLRDVLNRLNHHTNIIQSEGVRQGTDVNRLRQELSVNARETGLLRNALHAHEKELSKLCMILKQSADSSQVDQKVLTEMSKVVERLEKLADKIVGGLEEVAKKSGPSTP